MWNIKNKEAVSPVIGVILMVAITVVLAAVLYVWVSGFMTSTTGGVYAISAGTWTDGGTEATASIISTTPTAGIKCSDITWQLVWTSNSTVALADEIPTSPFAGASQTGATLAANDLLKAGCTVKITHGGCIGDFKVRAIVGGSQVYESATFTLAL